MSKTALNTIKNWFKTGLKPTQSQFWDTWDSFWHKDDAIPSDRVEGLADLLNGKASADALGNHIADENAHALLFEAKQDTLESGVTIKTINGESLLGEGDMEVTAGSSGFMASTVDSFVNTETSAQEVFFIDINHSAFTVGTVFEWKFMARALNLNNNNINFQPVVFGSGIMLGPGKITGDFYFELTGYAIKKEDGSWEVVHKLKRYAHGFVGAIIDVITKTGTTPVGGSSSFELFIGCNLVGGLEFLSGYIKQVTGANGNGGGGNAQDLNYVLENGDLALNKDLILEYGERGAFQNYGYIKLNTKQDQSNWATPYIEILGNDDGVGDIKVKISNEYIHFADAINPANDKFIYYKDLEGIEGPPGADGADGADGQSAYEIAVANGFVGTEVEWLASLKGNDGVNGVNGADGTNGNDGLDGQSAYEIAVANGFLGTETEWLESLQGAGGDNTITEVNSSANAVDIDVTARKIYEIHHNTNDELTINLSGEGKFDIFIRKGVADIYNVAIPNAQLITAVDFTLPERTFHLVGTVLPDGKIYINVNIFNNSSPFVPQGLKTIFLGDLHDDYANLAPVASAIVARNPDYMINAGDIYPNGTQAEFELTLAGYQSLIDAQKYYHIKGDHELNLTTTLASLGANVGTNIFAASSAWKWFATALAAELPTNWKLSNFDDLAWASGAGPFGYGETVGTVVTSLRLNYLFRKTINKSSITSNGVVIELSIDDGAEIYLNGEMIFSFNMAYPITPISGARIAVGTSSSAISVYEEGTIQTLRIPASYFVAGDNQLAVLVKNDDETSSDLFFSCAMHNYTFPSVGVFGSMPFQSNGFGDGMMGMIPYLPANGEQYSIVQNNIEYFFITTGRRDTDNKLASPAGQLGDSQQAAWLRSALAASTAVFKVLVAHDPPVSKVFGRNYVFLDYVLSNLNYPIDVMLVGDSHVSEMFQHSSGLIVANASNHDITSRNEAAIQATTPGDWTTLYFDNVAGNNYFIEITRDDNRMRLQYLDINGNVIFEKIITKRDDK